MLCVPRSWAASPCVIERMTVILSATLASLGSVSQNSSPVFVLTGAMLAAILDRGVRLGIERFLVGHAARQEDVNDALGLGLDEVVVLLLGLGLAQAEEVGQRQPQAADGANGQSMLRRLKRFPWHFIA